jgi:hypothetical protein
MTDHFRLSFRAQREKSFFDLEYDMFKLNHYSSGNWIDSPASRVVLENPSCINPKGLEPFDGVLS